MVKAQIKIVKAQSSKEKKIPKKSAPKKKSNEEKRNAMPVYLWC
jgi:hypothetical protein